MIKTQDAILNIHTTFYVYNIHTLNMAQICGKWIEKIYYADSKYKKAMVAIFILANRNFKTKSIIKGKEKHFITITESICQEKCKYTRA